MIGAPPARRIYAVGMRERSWRIPTHDSGLSDWSGYLLDPAILQALTVGNVVRIQIQQFEDYSRGWTVSPYARITEVDGDDLAGVIADPYRTSDEPEVSNGDIVHFVRKSVIEIPTDWEGNEDLEGLAVRTGGGRMTGILPPTES